MKTKQRNPLQIDIVCVCGSAREELLGGNEQARECEKVIEELKRDMLTLTAPCHKNARCRVKVTLTSASF